MFWPIYSTTTADPFLEMRRLQREVNRLFRGVGGEGEPFPAVNVWSNEESVTVTAEIPGLDGKDLNLQVNGDQLTIAGERKLEEPAEGVVCHRCERGSGKFARTLQLPYEIESGKVAAQYRHGVLTISLPRAEAGKPRKIAVATE